MAAGFSMKKEKLKDLEDFILEDFLVKNKRINLNNTYDIEISPNAINNNLTNDIGKLEPFGNGNPIPIFLIKNLKIIKATTVNNKHINVIFKPRTGKTIKSICFNSFNTQLSKYLLSYKKDVHVIAQIRENYWNNNRFIQLNIKDLLIEFN